MLFNFFVNILCFVFMFNCVLSIPVHLTTENIKTAEDIPLETQHAVCKVFTKEIEATAKATITRQLIGVCSSRDLDLKFHALQNMIQREFQQIKQAMGLEDQHSQYKSLDVAVTTSTKAPITITPNTDLSFYEYSDYFESENNLKYSRKNSDRKVVRNTRKELQSNSKLYEEIATFNDTVVESSEGDLYFYYWRILEINKVLKRKDIYISSSPFSVLGHTLYLQFYPNYMDEYIGVLLKPDSNSFLKKHKIIFLGQKSSQNQISSRILYGIKNEEKIFKIESAMLDNDFISSDSLLIKIKIYLNS